MSKTKRTYINASGSEMEKGKTYWYAKVAWSRDYSEVIFTKTCGDLVCVAGTHDFRTQVGPSSLYDTKDEAIRRAIDMRNREAAALDEQANRHRAKAAELAALVQDDNKGGEG